MCKMRLEVSQQLCFAMISLVWLVMDEVGQPHTLAATSGLHSHMNRSISRYTHRGKKGIERGKTKVLVDQWYSTLLVSNHAQRVSWWCCKRLIFKSGCDNWIQDR